MLIKGALRSFGEEIQTQHFYINNINEVMITDMFVFFPQLNKQAAGLPHTNKVKQYEIVLSVCLFSLSRHKKGNM